MCKSHQPADGAVPATHTGSLPSRPPASIDINQVSRDHQDRATPLPPSWGHRGVLPPPGDASPMPFNAGPGVKADLRGTPPSPTSVFRPPALSQSWGELGADADMPPPSPPANDALLKLLPNPVDCSSIDDAAASLLYAPYAPPVGGSPPPAAELVVLLLLSGAAPTACCPPTCCSLKLARNAPMEA